MSARVRNGETSGLSLPNMFGTRADIGWDDVEASPARRDLDQKVSGQFDLAEMVSRMPRRYKIRDESFGKRVGKEEW